MMTAVVMIFVTVFPSSCTAVLVMVVGTATPGVGTDPGMKAAVVEVAVAMSGV